MVHGSVISYKEPKSFLSKKSGGNSEGFMISSGPDRRLRSPEFSNTGRIFFRGNPPFDYYCRIVHVIINQTTFVFPHAGLS
jgi:hypothetical protein